MSLRGTEKEEPLRILRRRSESRIFKKIKKISFQKSMKTMTNPVGRSKRIRTCLVPLDYEH